MNQMLITFSWVTHRGSLLEIPGLDNNVEVTSLIIFLETTSVIVRERKSANELKIRADKNVTQELWWPGPMTQIILWVRLFYGARCEWTHVQADKNVTRELWLPGDDVIQSGVRPKANAGLVKIWVNDVNWFMGYQVESP